MVERCFGGNLGATARYIGDLKCWPFSKPQRIAGLWVVGLEASEFYPNARVLKDIDVREADTWLDSPLLERRPELIAAGTRAYAVELDGRLALCDGLFGHFGMYPREVVVDRFHSMRPVPST